MHHLQDDRLFDCYLSERTGERPDPPTAEHLTDCTDCARRYAELTAFLDELRTEAETETDAVFTPERLRGQQQAIAARIAHVGHAARVISFPRRYAGDGTEHRVHRVATRWLAAAAAAGMFIGIGTAFFLESGAHGRVIRTAAISRPAHMKPATPVRLSQADPADDRFLSELELALDRPRTAELMPLDQLTPHVREVSNGR